MRRVSAGNRGGGADSSDLSEQEKRQVGAAFAGVAYWGVQAALWSSFIMVGLFVAASRLGGG